MVLGQRYLAQGKMLVKMSLTKPRCCCCAHSPADSYLSPEFGSSVPAPRFGTSRFRCGQPLLRGLSALICLASPTSMSSAGPTSPALNWLFTLEVWSLQSAIHSSFDSSSSLHVRFAILSLALHSHSGVSCFRLWVAPNGQNRLVMLNCLSDWAVRLTPPTLRFDSSWFLTPLRRNFCLWHGSF